MQQIISSMRAPQATSLQHMSPQALPRVSTGGEIQADVVKEEIDCGLPLCPGLHIPGG